MFCDCAEYEMLSQSSSPVDRMDESDDSDDRFAGSVCRGRKWCQDVPPAIVPESDRCEHNCPFCTKATCEMSMPAGVAICFCNTCDGSCGEKPCPQCCGTGGVVCQLCPCCVGFHSIDGRITAETADELLAKKRGAADQTLLAATLAQKFAKHLVPVLQ